MRTYLIFYLCLLSTALCVAQNDLTKDTERDSIGLGVVDDKYFEDQFYFGLTYNVLLSMPENTKQNNLSYGIQAGFIKDLPLNARRNFGIGIGAGGALNVMYSNLIVTEGASGTRIYQKAPEDLDYRRNNVANFLLEVPLELRWRTSTVTKYRFWRIYGGVKFSYLLYGRSKYVGEFNKIKFENPDIEDLQYGVYFSFGYNTWNFYAYYQLNNLFKDHTQTINNEVIDTKLLNLGVIFYIL